MYDAKFEKGFSAVCGVCNFGFGVSSGVVGVDLRDGVLVFHRGFYEVRFIKVRGKWYCKVPGFPKALFEHTMMVAGAANMLEYYAQGDDDITVQIRIPRKKEYDCFCGFRLEQTSATLTGGAFYKDPHGFFNEEFWLCPVTLFLLGKYPKKIYIYRGHKAGQRIFPVYETKIL